MASIEGNPTVRYGACEYRDLPRWEVAAETDDGTTLVLEERWLPTVSLLDTGPASLESAVVTIGGERIGAKYSVSDYWDLIYSASRHNTSVH